MDPLTYVVLALFLLMLITWLVLPAGSAATSEKESGSGSLTPAQQQA